VVNPPLLPLHGAAFDLRGMAETESA